MNSQKTPTQQNLNQEVKPIESFVANTLVINIIREVSLAAQATGLAIVIDVFRAFSTECFVLQNGAKYIIPVLTLEEAYELKKLNPDYILMGERKGVKPEGFDYGNSPTEVLDVDFTDKVVIHTTANGTKGMLNAINAEGIITGGFVNAEAILNYIKSQGVKEISLVSTSTHWEEENEDVVLAYYLKDILQGKSVDKDEIRTLLMGSSTVTFLRDEAKVPPTDIDLCLDFDRFDFVIRQIEKDGRKILMKQSV